MTFSACVYRVTVAIFFLFFFYRWQSSRQLKLEDWVDTNNIQAKCRWKEQWVLRVVMHTVCLPSSLPSHCLSKQISAVRVTCPNNSPSRHFPLCQPRANLWESYQLKTHSKVITQLRRMSPEFCDISDNIHWSWEKEQTRAGLLSLRWLVSGIRCALTSAREGSFFSAVNILFWLVWLVWTQRSYVFKVMLLYVCSSLQNPESDRTTLDCIKPLRTF